MDSVTAWLKAARVAVFSDMVQKGMVTGSAQGFVVELLDRLVGELERLLDN
jgi:hypothetical protein